MMVSELNLYMNCIQANGKDRSKITWENLTQKI